jgi:hypothetical protein
LTCVLGCGIYLENLVVYIALNFLSSYPTAFCEDWAAIWIESIEIVADFASGDAKSSRCQIECKRTKKQWVIG